jgi:hypothetical protein
MLSTADATADAKDDYQAYSSSRSSSRSRGPAKALASLGLTAAGAQALLQLAAALTQQAGQQQQQQLLNLDGPALQFLALARLAAAACQEQAAAGLAMRDQELAESVARVFQPVTVTRSGVGLSQSGAAPQLPRSPPPRLLLSPSPGATTPRSRSPLAGPAASPGGAQQLPRARSARSLGRQSTKSLQSGLSFSSLQGAPAPAPRQCALRRAARPWPAGATRLQALLGPGSRASPPPA